MDFQELNLYKKSVAEVQVHYNRLNQIQSAKISCSSDASIYLRKVFPIDLELKEAFMCLFLNRAHNVQGFSVISLGGLSGTVADPKLIFQNALLCNASSIIMAHNHPSGNIKPSQADTQLTRKIVELGKLMEQPILDHIILTAENYFSFADEALL
jgi:DNA repair protein RadC